MASGTGVRDFTDYANQPWPGKTFPITFNNVANAGDGFPGVQYAMRTWVKDYLHSGGMETGLNFNAKPIISDITGNLHNISGFDIISANTGQFAYISGFSDITIDTNLDFGGSYTLVNLQSGDANGEPIRYNEYQPMEVDYYTTSGTLDNYIVVSGDYVTASGDYVTHSGSISNPHTVTLDQAFDGGKIINGATSLANSFQIGDSTDRIRIWNDGADVYARMPESQNLALYFDRINADQILWFGLQESSNQVFIWSDGASTSDERGVIGAQIGGTVRPFSSIYSQNFFKDSAGSYGSYDFVDDLQLLREMHNSEESRAPIIKGVEQMITRFDLRTLPWVKAVPETEQMKDEDLKYAFDEGMIQGYMLSAMKKILERQDKIAEVQTDIIKRLAKLNA